MNATIHIVESDSVVRSALSALCQPVTSDVRCFSSLNEWLPGRNPNTPSCTIVGFDSAEMNGADVIHQVRSAQLRTPVILLDNSSNVSDAVQAMRAGAFDVMEKPFVMRLIPRVKEALSNSENV